MTRSSLTEETPSTPGWVEGRLRDLFAPFGAALAGPRDAYADCLAGVRGAADVDLGHDHCRRTLLAAVADQVADPAALDRALQALEADISDAT